MPRASRIFCLKIATLSQVIFKYSQRNLWEIGLENAVSQLGELYLKPYFEIVGGQFRENEIRLLRI